MSGILGLSAAMGKRKRQQLTARPSNNTPRENTKEIPNDLLINVFSRLPVEDVARCR